VRYQSTFRQIDTVTRLNAQTNKNADKVYWIGSKYILSLLSLNWQTTSHAERGKCLRMLGSAGGMQNSQRFALTELLLQKCVWNFGGVYYTKFELFLLKILMWKSEKRTLFCETTFWGYGFAKPRLISRAQEGSGEECARVFAILFWRRRKYKKNYNLFL